MSVAFDRPELLWLLVLVPAVLVVATTSRRRLARRRLALATASRLLLVAALVGALSELTLRREVDDLGVVFVVDRSASVRCSPRPYTSALSRFTAPLRRI